MPIKDPQKNREYKRLWIAKKRSRQNNVKSNNNFVELSANVEPLKSVELIGISKCSRCSDFQNSITNFYNLVIEEQEKVKEQKKINYQLEKKLKESEKSNRVIKKLELKIISLQETNQILRKDLGYWQEK